jgi:hypothetical protein
LEKINKEMCIIKTLEYFLQFYINIKFVNKTYYNNISILSIELIFNYLTKKENI